MKKKSLILMLVSIIVFVSMVAIAAYAYFAASVDANAEAIINATLPNGSFTFYVVTDGNIEYTFNANKMLASGSSTSSIASDDANLNVVLRSPDSTSLTTCSYDLVWEWTSSVQYTESDVTLPYTGGYNYEMSVKGTSSTSGNPSSNPSTNANLDEKDLSKFTWTGTKGQSGYKTTLVSGATISSQSAETDTVTSWNILSQMYNIPVAQPNLQGKEFKAKVYVDNVDCNITNADSGSGGQVSSTKPTVVNGTIDTIGSEVAIGDEHFYIINSTDTTVTMLAKYNLLVGDVWDSSYYLVSTYDGTEEGYGLQSETAKGYISGAGQYVGTVAFDSEYTTDSHGYWTDDSYNLLSEYGGSYPAWVYNDNATIKTYVDNYKTLLENNYGIGIDEVRLIKQEELVTLGCVASSKNCSSAPSWVYSTSYWSGSAGGYVSVWIVDSDGGFDGDHFGDDSVFGVRPVIIVLKSEF